MKRLILHVGPAKCGSTSIQKFFISNKSPCDEVVNFTVLDPNDIEQWNSKCLDHFEFKKLRKILYKNSNCDVLIVSHEFLFARPLAVSNIIKAGDGVFTSGVIVGYSRRQSEFLRSAYSQWYFRDKKTLIETRKNLVGQNIDELYFSGLEKYFISAIFSNFSVVATRTKILDWNASYAKLEENTNNDQIAISCGYLPAGWESKSLVEDFCDRAGLNLKTSVRLKSKLRENTAFNEDLVEAINSALSFGLEVPGPHEDNVVLTKISEKMTVSNSNYESVMPILIKYVDGYYLESNIDFCCRYNIDEYYFKADNGISKNDLLSYINQQEKCRRFDNDFLESRVELSAVMAKTCLDLSRRRAPMMAKYLKQFVMRVSR